MSTPASPDRYRGSAPYYTQGRMPYPLALAETFSGVVPTGPGARLLDVGCGPGRVTFALADRYDDILGVDVDTDMLAVAEATARERGLAHVQFRRLPAEEIDSRLGSFTTVTFGLSFHWLDQDRTARAVRSVLRPEGAVVHVYAYSLRGEPVEGEPAPPYEEVNALRARYLGADWHDRMPHIEPDAAVAAMQAAGFVGPDVVPVPGGELVTSSVDDLVARFFSSAASAPVRFGARVGEFEDDLRELLTRAGPEGRFVERQRDARLDVWRCR